MPLELPAEPPNVFLCLQKLPQLRGCNGNGSTETERRNSEARGQACDEAKASSRVPRRKNRRFIIDGKFLPEAEAKVSVFDHGLLYGDGIFEGIRFYNGRVFRLEEHLERLVGFRPLDLSRDSDVDRRR